MRIDASRKTEKNRFESTRSYAAFDRDMAILRKAVLLRDCMLGAEMMAFPWSKSSSGQNPLRLCHKCTVFQLSAALLSVNLKIENSTEKICLVQLMDMRLKQGCR